MSGDVNAAFKRALKARTPLFGLFVGQPAPSVVELIGYAGFDFAIIDTEHGPAGGETLENMIRAAESAGVATVVRVVSGSAADILHALDSGASAILVPHVTSAEVARSVVENSYYPPLGKRGISTMSRAARYSLANRTYIADQAARTSVLVMVEDAVALPHAAAIAGVAGVDAVFVGPSDLAASMGHPGDPAHPDVAQALSALWPVIAGAKAAALSTTARTADDARKLQAVGASMLCFNAVNILASGLKQLRAAL